MTVEDAKEKVPEFTFSGRAVHNVQEKDDGQSRVCYRYEITPALYYELASLFAFISGKYHDKDELRRLYGQPEGAETGSKATYIRKLQLL